MSSGECCWIKYICGLPLIGACNCVDHNVHPFTVRGCPFDSGQSGSQKVEIWTRRSFVPARRRAPPLIGEHPGNGIDGNRGGN
jgi:hypothetical protein